MFIDRYDICLLMNDICLLIDMRYRHVLILILILIWTSIYVIYADSHRWCWFVTSVNCSYVANVIITFISLLGWTIKK